MGYRNTSGRSRKRGRLISPANPPRQKRAVKQGEKPVQKPYVRIFTDGKKRFFLPNVCGKGYRMTTETVYRLVTRSWRSCPAAIHFARSAGD